MKKKRTWLRHRRSAGLRRRRVPHVPVLLRASAATSSARTRPGNLDPSDIGVANATFLKNAPLIDKWNKEGLINSKVDGAAAQNAFLKGQAALLDHRPWNADTLKKSGLKFKVIQMPAIVEAVRAVPRRPGLHGHEVRRGARRRRRGHHLVTNYLATPSAQTQLAAANGRSAGEHQRASRATPSSRSSPLRGRAACRCRTSRRWARVWGDLGQAWVKSTKGAGATKATVAFKAAARRSRTRSASTEVPTPGGRPSGRPSRLPTHP